jgi:hypothetical protein
LSKKRLKVEELIFQQVNRLNNQKQSQIGS